MPSPPGTFPVVARIEMAVDFGDWAEDQHHTAAELRCCYRTGRGWFRRMLTERGVVVFEFEDGDEATRFQRANRLQSTLQHADS